MGNSEMQPRTYIIYDGRAIWGDTDDASVCCCADSLEEAKADVRDMFPDGVVYSYRDQNDWLVDERLEWYLLMEAKNVKRMAKS